ncbi:hypothetical protein K501DRAFT_287283 [Backusella circina FSU 941]|nr:hypothetical protein K501DRAFT_287283 [Backusella circina FSU 941]
MFLSTLSGLILGVLAQILDKKTGIIQAHFTLIQSIFSLLSILCITSLGFKIMMRTKPSSKDEYDLSVKWTSIKPASSSRIFDVFITGCLPFIYIANQSIGIPQIVQKSDFMTLIQVSLILLISCSVLGLSYYAALLCWTYKMQKLSLTSLLYFMGALDMSKLFGMFEQPVLVKNIIQLIRESHPQYSLTRRLMNALVGTKDVTNWNGTGYSIYWILIAISIVYIHKK